MFLEKYKNKKRLGKGAYGDVYLVEDQDGKLYALKLISVKMIQEEPHLQEYLDGQIECMKAMDSPHIIQLYKDYKDNDFIYFLLEYCDQGDLINYQAKLKDKVFSLSKATEVLAEVIKGLEALHQEQYLHRDIKSQNVLVKIENGREVFKLADFGFSKKHADVGGTILGTEQFMAPEIYEGQDYGYEVDMWAFGVLFYFMLNLEFPFKTNPHWPPNRKQAQLRKAAQNFSYTAFVKKSKKRIMANCTADMESLFKQIFTLNAKDRINFADIRKEPIFIKYFPEVAQSSIILYSKKYVRKEVQPSRIQHKYKNKDKEEDMIVPTSRVYRKQYQQFQMEKQILGRKKDQLDFLRDNAEIFLNCGDYLKPEAKFMLAFNLQKFFIILLRRFKTGLSNRNYLNDRYPNLNWKEYCSMPSFQEHMNAVEEDLGKAQVRFEIFYESCQHFSKQISKINSGFAKAFRQQISETDFEGLFKESYRKSTIYVFGLLRELHKKGVKKGNKLNYLLCILLISNSFNSIFEDKQNLSIILKDYLAQNKKVVDKIDYCELRNWLESSNQNILHEMAKNIVKAYFGS